MSGKHVKTPVLVPITGTSREKGEPLTEEQKSGWGGPMCTEVWFAGMLDPDSLAYHEGPWKEAICSRACDRSLQEEKYGSPPTQVVTKQHEDVDRPRGISACDAEMEGVEDPVFGIRAARTLCGTEER